MQKSDEVRKALELARDAIKGLWRPQFGSLPIDGSRPAVVMAIQQANAAIDAALSAPAAPVAKPLTDEQIARHTLTAGECPPGSKVLLVSSVNRLRERAHGITKEGGAA